MFRWRQESACSRPCASACARQIAPAPLEIRTTQAQHAAMIAALFGTVFLVFFMLSPLHWVALGMPWITLVITFLLIPLLDAAVGAPAPGPRSAPAFARWIPRLQLPLQIVLLVQAVRIAPQLECGSAGRLRARRRYGDRQPRHHDRARTGPSRVASRPLHRQGAAGHRLLRPFLRRTRARPPRTRGHAG